MRRLLTGLCLVAALASPGCVGRRAVRTAAAPAPAPTAPVRGRSPAEIQAGFEDSKRATPHIPPLSEEEAHKAMPTLFKGRAMPNLLLVGGLQPRTMEAVLAVAKQARTEGELEPKLLNDVFWAVSSVNECFY